MKMKSIFLSLIFFLTFPLISNSEPIKERMVGGQFVRLDDGPVALILTSSFRCSGILVGAREILTAAHCVADSTPNTDYTVIVGGGIYGVESRFYSGSYNPNGNVILNAPYDLGILILSQSVTGTNPVPVLFNDAVEPGESAIIYGYGTNELSGLPNRFPWEDAKAGQMVISNSSNGLLSSIHSLGGASTCHGDSGGPAIETLGEFAGLIGILTVGVNKEIGGTCFLTGDGLFSYVDIQSPSSQGFLSNFPGVTYISGYRIYVHSMANLLTPKLKSALKAKSTSDLAKKLKSILKQLNSTVPYSDGDGKSLLKSAAKNIKLAQNTRSLSAALKIVKKALTSMKKLSSLGV